MIRAKLTLIRFETIRLEKMRDRPTISLEVDAPQLEMRSDMKDRCCMRKTRTLTGVPLRFTQFQVTLPFQADAEALIPVI